ncbi:MAG: aminodeoxychorismate synthase component I [Acidobacteriota bacterium]|nr:aminodeoxychorismate synthase component I [Acidobacteriota bacterium]
MTITAPGSVLLRDGSCWRAYTGPRKILVANNAESLQETLRAVEEHRQSGGEAAGFLAYEAGYALEPRLRHLLRPSHAPLAWFGLYDRCRSLSALSGSESDDRPLIRNSKLAITRQKYFQKLDAIRHYIEAGDVYQINFTTRVHFQSKLEAFDLFSALFHRHPAPYAAFVNTGDAQIVSLSPEMFFQIDGGRIFVRPMKGTAPRGLQLEDDEAAAARLRASEKNRAENVMIVDLMRNDLGRICRSGSVKTTSLFDIERYPSVWQMTSTVEGALGPDCTAESIVRALFPSGSVTGAPKIRAMEIIAELENVPRGIYTGSIGYFSKNRAHFNVAIRTVVLNRRKGIMGIGGGITHDSSAPDEWNECHWKAAFLLESEPQFGLIETFYWDRRYRLLRAHLARLRDSTKYWNFACDERRIISALENAAKHFPPGPRRVRLMLASDGEIKISDGPYDSDRFGRVGISRHVVNSGDRFLYHKTTHRARYDQELASARKRELDDVLFFNQRGELTEGTIHNVFVVKRGVWRTPPVACGLLSGVFRDHVLKTRKYARESVLRLPDLRNSDAIYLCNSVRGLYPVALQERGGKRKEMRRPEVTS